MPKTSTREYGPFVFTIECNLNIAGSHAEPHPTQLRGRDKLGASVCVRPGRLQLRLWHVPLARLTCLPSRWPATAGLRLKSPPGSSRQGRLRTPARRHSCWSLPLRSALHGSARIAAAPPLHGHSEGAAAWRHSSTVHTTFGPMGERLSWAPSRSQRPAIQSRAWFREAIQKCKSRLWSSVCALAADDLPTRSALQHVKMHRWDKNWPGWNLYWVETVHRGWGKK